MNQLNANGNYKGLKSGSLSSLDKHFPKVINHIMNFIYKLVEGNSQMEV